MHYENIRPMHFLKVFLWLFLIFFFLKSGIGCVLLQREKIANENKKNFQNLYEKKCIKNSSKITNKENKLQKK